MTAEPGAGGCSENRMQVEAKEPERDLFEGSLYMQALRMLEESWEIIASLFPQVKIWEVGNEWYLNAFLHPDGFLDSDMSNPFSPDEKIDIAIDLMYFSAKGIRKGNPEARVASFSPALSTTSLGGDMPEFLPVKYGLQLCKESSELRRTASVTRC